MLQEGSWGYTDTVDLLGMQRRQKFHIHLSQNSGDTWNCMLRPPYQPTLWQNNLSRSKEPSNHRTRAPGSVKHLLKLSRIRQL